MSGSILALLLKIVLGDDTGFLKFKLTLHVGRFINAMRRCLFSNSQQPPNILRKVLTRSFIDSKTRTHLRRLIFRDQLHVFSR